jgi:hypothetical protein
VMRGPKPNLERRRHVAELRSQGLTYAQIGEQLGMSRQCAHLRPSCDSERLFGRPQG